MRYQEGVFTWRALITLWSVGIQMIDAANTFEMVWSTKTYGPDGPWHAINITIGAQQNVVSLYPGGIFSSHILSPKICQNASLGVCYAQSAGLYDNTLSASASFDQISFTTNADFTGGALNIGGSPGEIGTDTWNVGNSMQMMYEMDMAVHDSIWGTLPDGTTYPITVGGLSLGAPGGAVNQTFDGINATLLTGWLETEAPPNKVIASNSWGMHIGAADVAIPPSLIMGGFDQNRVLGQVSTQQGTPEAPRSIDLVDISLNVLEGESPWSFNNQSGFLASGNSSINRRLPVAVNSQAPYLHLPRSTCDAIAKLLPVTFQPKYGLYFWNIKDPQYARITSSPSVLSFTFTATESTSSTLTIKVPFRLLNLTLEEPLIDKPTTYFPCKTEERAGANFILGRAFLQAAFVGANFDGYDGPGAWWLAQAPGPNIPTQSRVISIAKSDISISSSTSDWETTWNTAWTPLTASDLNSSPATTNTPSQGTSGVENKESNTNTATGLSAGAKAGIGIGAVLGVGALLAVVLLFIRRKRTNKRSVPPPEYQDGDVGPVAQVNEAGFFAPKPRDSVIGSGINKTMERHEVPGSTPQYEVESAHTIRYEVPG
jgi:hypothetical protein